MATLINSEDINPEDLRQAIKQLQPELPDLLGSKYPSFAVRLTPLLFAGSNEELLALFAPYPAAYYRLQDILNYLIAGHGLYGDSVSIKPSTRYICPEGSHPVEEAEVQKKDVVGRPLCPRHGKVLSPAPQT
jgi:hypothetical protein